VPPSLAWADLRGARVGLWGLGVEGRANLARLRALAVEPVAVVDDAPPVPPADLGVDVVATTAGGLEQLAACDVVVKSPGISRLRPEVAVLEGAGVAVAGGLGLWVQGLADPSRVALVTGTKGKSTTTRIAGHLAIGLGRRPFVGGNLGAPPWDPAADGDHDLWVVETSSYQATDLARAPRTVVVTSLHPDHLDWHGTFERYAADKLSVCTRPGAHLVVANGDDDALRDHARLLGSHVRWLGRADAIAGDWDSGLSLRGDHNRVNAVLAAACLEAIGVDGADDPHRLAVAALGFAGLPSRLQVVARAGAVEFVDDGLATNVLPVLRAVEAFPGRRVALIVGGRDRGIDYDPLAEGLAERTAPLLVLTIPDNGERIRAALTGRRLAPIAVEPCADLETAVARGAAWADPDGVVLLSPAAPSYGRYRDYRDRGEAFTAAAVATGATPT
jgi:UDP-N-acetylmuramoyl-L-alanine---L-glutamate ligase